MAAGQKFNLDLDAENWQFDLHERQDDVEETPAIKGILERNSVATPAAPVLKSTKTGFPEHRPRKAVSKFKQQRGDGSRATEDTLAQRGPSDRAILHHAAQKHGISMNGAKQGVDQGAGAEKVGIDAENRSRIDAMSLDEIEEARAELMAQFNPETLRKFLQRNNADRETNRQPSRVEPESAGDPNAFVKYLQKADLDQEQKQQEEQFENHESSAGERSRKVRFELDEKQESHVDADELAIKSSESPSRPPTFEQPLSPAVAAVPSSDSIHFPNPPRRKEDYKALDPSSDKFLEDLREHYFPDLPHDPNALSWLQDETAEEEKDSPYNPDRAGYAPSAIRFDFNGRLIPPSESQAIPTSAGLHHHGDAPSSAGYTIPELTLLARSTLPNQRCVAYQVTGRILYRLGRGDYGPKGNELSEGLWNCIEKERIVEVMMTEANKQKGHLSARTFATEAVWHWQRGGGGNRGVLKEGQTRGR